MKTTRKRHQFLEDLNCRFLSLQVLNICMLNTEYCYVNMQFKWCATHDYSVAFGLNTVFL